MIRIENDPNILRDAFIDAFVDQESVFYKDRIVISLQDSESSCYRGYLWECFKTYDVVSITWVLHKLSMSCDPVYAMCDLHPEEYFPVGWDYPRDVVFSFDAKNTEKMISVLPEDCYFFDDSLRWAIALTHEEIKPGKRSCIFVNLP